MDFSDKFRKLGEIDTARIKELVLLVPDEDWIRSNDAHSRGPTHIDVQPLPMLWDIDLRHMDPTPHQHYEKFEAALAPVFEFIANYYGNEGWLVRALFARLKPQGIIPLHKDKGFSLTHGHRIHIPIITNEKSRLYVDGSTKALREGEVWEINNVRAHGAENNGDAWRVHFIADWAPPMTDQEKAEYCHERILMR
jgi:hypothetical protein